MIDIKNKIDCDGCCACYDICPHDAITLDKDIEGFWYPTVHMDKCTDCHLCEQTCPELHVSELKTEKPFVSKYFGAINKNLEVRFDSTSGGLFSVLADKMYSLGGYVGGAVFDEHFLVNHYVSNEKKDLDKLRSSKYLQSDASNLYKDIKGLLKKGEKVLVCGTPCQMGALKLFLRKDYENLILVDFICRGVNSPKVFRKYLDSLEEEFKSKVVYVKAKNKELGWRNLTTKISFESGKSIFQTKENSYFTRGYLHTNVYCRPSCYECKFKGFPRIADITLADFWGVEKVDKELDNDLGTSLVLVNTQRGMDYFNQIKSKIQYKEVSYDQIVKGNPALNSSLNQPIVDRGNFFRDLDVMSFKQIAEKYFPFKALSFKQKTKKILRTLFELFKQTDLNVPNLYRFVQLNFFTKNIKVNLNKPSFFIPNRNCVISISSKSEVLINGDFRYGVKKFKESKLESRLLVESGSKLRVDSDFTFYYGANVEVFTGGELIIKGGGGTNIGTTIICKDRIEIGQYVQIGRHVTIRDNNGGHFIARQGYKDSRPVIIGDRAWLGEGCTIMPGVKIGEGAIIGAKAVVFSNVPAHSIVVGNPAEVVDENVYWKY